MKFCVFGPVQRYCLITKRINTLLTLINRYLVMEKNFLKDSQYFREKIFRTAEEKNDSEKELEEIFDKVLESENNKELEKIEVNFNLENFINDPEKQTAEITDGADIEEITTEIINGMNKNSEEIKGVIEKNDSLGNLFIKIDLDGEIKILQSVGTPNLEQELENSVIIKSDINQDKIAYAFPYNNFADNKTQELSDDYLAIPDYLSFIKSYEIKKTGLNSNTEEVSDYINNEEQRNRFQKPISSISGLMIESFYEPKTESMSESMLYSVSRISRLEKTDYDDE